MTDFEKNLQSVELLSLQWNRTVMPSFAVSPDSMPEKELAKHSLSQEALEKIRRIVRAELESGVDVEIDKPDGSPTFVKVHLKIERVEGEQ